MKEKEPQIFLAPRSNETAYKNFKSTIKDGVDYKQVEPFLTEEGQTILKAQDKIFAWGNKETKKTSWGKMNTGDLVLFYKDKKFVYSGKLVFKQQSENLSTALWPSKKGQKPWTCVFFLKDLTPIDLPVSKVNELSKGVYKLDRIQGFMPVKQTVVKGIIEAYGTLDSFIDQFKKGASNLNVDEIDNVQRFPVSKLGTKFEEEVRDFMKKLEFADVNGGAAFYISDIQIDAIGGSGNSLLVVECKTKFELKKSSLRSAISDIRGKIPFILEGLKKDEVYKKYTNIRFVIATKNIEIGPADVEYANRIVDSKGTRFDLNKNLRIYIWNDDFIEYYSDLYSLIRPYSKFNLLGEMGIAPYYERPVKVFAIRTKIGNVYVYNFVINPRDLLKVSFVARRNVGQERYYQRIIDESRLGKIAKYIDQGGFFPNNIVLSFREDLKGLARPQFEVINKFGDQVEYGLLRFPQDYRACWIIDGQHRLYAFANLKEKFYFNMSVTAFDGLEISKQKKFFLDINRNQRPVDPDLLWDLSGDTPTERDGIISNIVKNLNKSWNGPLHNKIYYPSVGMKEKKEKIKISALCIALRNYDVINKNTTQNIKNLLYSDDPLKLTGNIYKSLELYFATIKEIFSKNWELKKNGFIMTNGGIAIFIGLYERIISRSFMTNVVPDSEYFRSKLLPIKDKIENASDSDLKKLRLATASEGGRTDILNELILEIRSGTKDQQFGGDIKETSLLEEFKDLEKKIKDLIYKKCHKDGEDWFKNVSDSYTYDAAKRRLEKNHIHDVDNLYLQTGLGECFSILRKNKELFYPVFTDMESEYSFSNERIFEAALTVVADYRNRTTVHYTGNRIKKQDEEMMVKIYLDKINKCLDEELSQKEFKPDDVVATSHS